MEDLSNVVKTEEAKVKGWFALNKVEAIALSCVAFALGSIAGFLAHFR